MRKNILKVLSIPDKAFQVVIYRTESGVYSYAKRWWDKEREDYGALGPACGFYDSAATAEEEARRRTEGLDPWESQLSLH